MIIIAGDGKENEVEFHRLLDGLYDDYEPVGAMEEMLVQSLAVNRWRKWRVLRAEVGAIRALLNSVIVEKARARADKVKVQDDEEAGYDQLRRSSAGIAFLLEGMEAIRGQLSTADPEVGSDVLHDGNVNWLVSNLGWDREWVTDNLDNESKEEPRWSSLLDLLDDDRTDLVNSKPDVEREEALALEAEKARLALPDGPAAERRLRYEKSIDAEFNRILAMLEAVRRARPNRSTPPAQLNGSDAYETL